MASKFGKGRTIVVAVSIGLSTTFAACTPHEVITHGAVISQDQIELIPVGSSREQVLLALGTPSTTGSFDHEVFYYISQKKQRKYAYQKPRLVDQRVLAVYFDEENTVANVANYGIQDGMVFDFISRTTPTGGKDNTFLGQILTAGSGPAKTGPPTFPGSQGRL
jgi:outer membrane protein assembly factor BamE (lipoprotein component of BamABCDE complex)